MKRNFVLSIILMFCLTSISYSESKQVQTLSEATPFQMIDIMIEEGVLDEAEGMLQSIDSSKKDNFEYYKLMGKLKKEKGDVKKAIEFYSKASKKKPTDISVKISVLKLRIQNNEKAAVIRKEIEELLKLDLKPDYRKDIEALAKAFEEKKKDYLLSFSTGLVSTDNVYETKEDKKSDIYIDTRLTAARKRSFKDIIDLTCFASYGNKLYFSESDKNSHNIFLGVEPEKKISDWKLSIPVTYNTNSENGETTSSGFSLGAKGKTTINKNMLLTTGIDWANTENKQSDYKGSSILLYANVNLNILYGINITPELSLETTSYDDDTQNYMAFAGKISGRKLLKEKYMVTASYKITSKSYSDADRQDLNHNLSANMESGIGKTKWRYNVGYGIRMNDSDSSDNEYTVSNLSLKVKRDFN